MRCFTKSVVSTAIRQLDFEEEEKMAKKTVKATKKTLIVKMIILIIVGLVLVIPAAIVLLNRSVPLISFWGIVFFILGVGGLISLCLALWKGFELYELKKKTSPEKTDDEDEEDEDEEEEEPEPKKRTRRYVRKLRDKADDQLVEAELVIRAAEKADEEALKAHDDYEMLLAAARARRRP